MYPTRKLIGLFLGPLLFVLTLLFIRSEGLGPEARGVLATTLWVATWWILEVIPISATALLPLLLFPLTGAIDFQATATSFANPMIFLFMGGFMIAVTIEKWNLHRRIALSIIALIGTDLRMIILGFMVATGFLSMWISNTATAVMMMPIGLAVARQLGAGLGRDIIEPNDLGRALMLAIAYGSSIGGMATIIGTPTNVILTGVVQELYGIEIGFAQWMLFGLPVATGLLLLAWYYLVRFAYRLPRGAKIGGGRAEVERQLSALGPMSAPEKRVLVVFILVALAWISRSYLLAPVIPGLNDAMIGLVGVVILFLLPAGVESKAREALMDSSDPDGFVHDRANTGQPRRQRLLDWQTAEGIPWGILLLFGGGLALATGFRQSGLADWIGTQLALLEAVPYLLLLLLLITAVNFLTEITSNVATASMLLPILAALAASIGVHPYGLMVAATVAASCAFMLPVATPPNAVVFGSGYLSIAEMIRVGVWLNILSIVLLTLLIYFLLPLAWGIDLSSFPTNFSQLE
ncbi:anion transporter [Lewinellaceae bacterium SD302]|nr:anion transporter [Lewinellaceae bacterium SD302]